MECRFSSEGIRFKTPWETRSTAKMFLIQEFPFRCFLAKIAGMYNPESMGFFIIVSQRGRKIEGEATRKGSVAKEKGRRGREGESRGYSSSFSPQRPARAVFNAEERERT